MSELKAYRIKGNTLGDFDDVYIKSEADKVIAEKDAEIARLKAKLAEKDKEIARQNEAWNRLCKKYNKFVSLKQEFCEKFKDIELEITK